MRNIFRFIRKSGSYADKNDVAQTLYEDIKDLPIYDYHCHLDPKEIWEDQPFDNIGEMWLAHDHYKWRLMRQCGIDEKYITGDASWLEKFIYYAKAVSQSPGNPLYQWTRMELEIYFGITDELNEQSAADIWAAANDMILSRQLSPRKLIALSHVRYIATTDDMLSSLSYHQKLRDDSSLQTVVAPSFRTDLLLNVNRPDYASYLEQLSACTNIQINSLDDLKQAVRSRLDYFVANGCRFTDVGIESFPRIIGSDEEADAAFRRVLAEEPLSTIDLNLFLGNMYVFLGCEYAKRNLVMQMHLAVKRNANDALFSSCGPDAGGDCMGDPIPGDAVIALLNQIQQTQGILPITILYSMNESMLSQLASIACSFSRVHMGAAWWMFDHARGIAHQTLLIAEQGSISSFYGMLTDSRSFTSYARHDYFRRILARIVAGWVEQDDFPMEAAHRLLVRVCCENIREVIDSVD